MKGHAQVKTWKDLRDERIVKQDLDYSCGAASFQDLTDVVRPYGLKGIGVASNFG